MLNPELLPFFQYLIYPIVSYLYYLGFRAFKRSHVEALKNPDLWVFRRNMVFMFLCTITMLLVINTLAILKLVDAMLWYMYDLATLGVYIYYNKKILEKHN